MENVGEAGSDPGRFNSLTGIIFIWTETLKDGGNENGIRVVSIP